MIIYYYLKIKIILVKLVILINTFGKMVNIAWRNIYELEDHHKQKTTYGEMGR